MIALFKKEINIFFSSSIGYFIIGVFLLISSLFVWVFDSEFNILNYGYASMDSFFLLSPIIFLVFIPAINMHMFSQEYKTGTIEILLAKPISNMQIIMAKYLASITLIFLSIIPTFLYVITIFQLGENIGNIDLAGTIGSYIGLFFMCALFSSINIFTSSVTSNQVTAFLFGILLNLLWFYGFDLISEIGWLTYFDLIIQKIGVSYHYQYMSKGLLRFVDIFYFVSVSFLFIKLTQHVINKR